MVEDGRTGSLFEPGDVGALAAEIRRLVADPALRGTLGRNARSRVDGEFSADIYYDRLSALYDRVIHRGDKA